MQIGKFSKPQIVPHEQEFNKFWKVYIIFSEVNFWIGIGKVYFITSLCLT